MKESTGIEEENKMKISKAIIYICIIFAFLIVCINTNYYIIKEKEKSSYKYTSIWETIEKLENEELELNDINVIGIDDTLDILLYDKSLWNKLPLSDNFLKKYKNPKSIIKKYNKYESIDMGISRDYDSDNVIVIMCTERDDIFSLIKGRNITTEYTFEYTVDDKNQLDDLKLLKEVDIDSMTAETYAVREY